MYRGAYLYWHTEGSKRCWSNRRVGRAMLGPARRAVLDPDPTPAPPPPALVMPAGLMPPHLIEPAPRTILDSPRWAWVADARAAAHEDDVPYSTFAPGTEPDIWPRIERPMPAVVITLLIGQIALLLALLLWRWHAARLRMT